ncbi:hypothetical protein [Azospirillum sp. SYSU D00513]|uniref:hypothetical protein n=1 Tax=Azospirillum sp. SYSU D00513 TaxID=2812561 RepID=UPI001A96F2F8|nr:hypothetical protein [Azospirillum sp. SYSU D00513]
MLPSVVEFDGVCLSVVDRAGRPWIAFPDLVRALYGIKGDDTSVTPFVNVERALRRVPNSG